MIIQSLNFEKPIFELELKIEELRQLSNGQGKDLSSEILRLEKKCHKMKQQIFSKLTRWQRTQLARHPNRPYAMDYIQGMTADFLEFHGDRLFRDDPAMVGGVAKLEGQSVVLVGQQKGRSTKENIYRNFGMPHPEGFRKAHRLFQMADKFRLPLITLIDTSGAYPGIGAEERGQAEAIAQNLKIMAGLCIPVIAVVIGEGGSGGALALGVANRVLMLEYAIYTVITPEGCAAILWENQEKAPDASEALKLTAQDLLELGVIDDIVPEPCGGAHRDMKGMTLCLQEVLTRYLAELLPISPKDLQRERHEKFRRMGVFRER